MEIKSKLVLANTFAVAFVEKFTLILRSSIQWKIKREIKIAVKSDERIPIIKVVAKPCTGPVPNT